MLTFFYIFDFIIIIVIAFALLFAFTSDNNDRKKDNAPLYVFFLFVLLLINYFVLRNDYYKQIVDIERIKNIIIENDIASIQDFQPEGMQVDWKHFDLENLLHFMKCFRLQIHHRIQIFILHYIEIEKMQKKVSLSTKINQLIVLKLK